MRIVLVHKDFEPHRGGGGTARHIHGLASALGALGADVRVVAPHPEKITSPYRTWDLAKFEDLREHVEWADVVHVHGARSVLAFRAAHLAKSLGKPFFYTAHCWYKPRSLGNAIGKALWDQTAERYMLANCAGTIILTDVWHDYLRGKYLPTGKLIVYPNCVLKSELTIAPRRKSSGTLAPVIYSVGRLSPEKRGRDVIAALADPLLAGAKLKIAGKGADRPALEDFARQLGVADRVTFLGFVSDEESAKIAAEADVFVLASEEEGLPTILLEMILAGVPIVCTKIPGNLAITRPAGVEAVYDVGDIKTLAKLLARPEPVTPDGYAAVENLFTWENVGPKILSAYRASVSMTSPGGGEAVDLETRRPRHQANALET